MEIDNQNTIGSEDFLKMRAEYGKERNIGKGIELLKKLVEVDGENIDENAWLDCKDLITMILGDISTNDLLSQNQILFLQAIPNTTANVVNLLATILEKKPSVTKLLAESAIAVAVAFVRRINEQECFESISRLVAPVADNPLIIEELKVQLESHRESSEARFRFYQILVEIFRADMYQPNHRFLLASLAEDLTNSKDILTQLTALSLFGDCAIINEKAAKIIDEEGVPRKIYEMLKMSKESPDGGYLYTECIRFFGHLARQYPQTIDTFPEFVPLVVDLIQHFDYLDPSQRVLAFDTFANMVYSLEAKQKIEKILEASGTLPKVLSKFGVAVNHGPAELRIRHIEAASIMFENGNDEMALKWYRLMGDSPFTSTILKNVQTPFTDIRQAFMSFILQIFEYPLIILDYVNSAGVNEWLLNEHTETEYETAQLKKAIIRKMIKTAETEETKNVVNLEPSFLIKLKSSLISAPQEPRVELAL